MNKSDEVIPGTGLTLGRAVQIIQARTRKLDYTRPMNGEMGDKPTEERKRQARSLRQELKLFGFLFSESSPNIFLKSIMLMIIASLIPYFSSD